MTSAPHAEPPDKFRVPSGYSRCRRASCTAPPVADMARSRTRWYGSSYSQRSTWWAYFAEHLADYNRDVRDGVVWWCGTDEDGLTRGIHVDPGIDVPIRGEVS